MKKTEFIRRIKSLGKRGSWYCLLLILSTIYILKYRNNLYQLTELNAQNLIFLLWLILLLMPLFSEIEIGSIKLKKEIEETRAEVKESIGDLKYQILEMRINNSNSNTVVFGSQPLSSKDALSELQRHVENGQELNDKNTMTFNVTEDSIFLFKVRLDLEKRLSAICDLLQYNERKTMPLMINSLIRHEVIDYDTASLIREIVNITNRGVHGEVVDIVYIEFTKTVYPSLKQKLDKIYKYYCKNSFYFECPSCQYRGTSKYNNKCPECGFVLEQN